ncbi:MAG: CocE/NonD family hydrolase [bacterium]
MVRLPDPALYGPGPYPTVIEYSGYAPSRPDQKEPGTNIASSLGFATVAVNMRGTGCSGGVFDVFNPAQHADGYDVVETVARQDFVLGHRVGMVGLSYSGIAQLFVARTNPPSLAAVTPLSVIADPWQEQWPGGIYNQGFTRSWLEQRDSEAAAGGQSWTHDRIARGDTTCAAHQRLRSQNIDFEAFLHALEFYNPDARDRSLPRLVHEIRMPVYLTGAFQDEQTGAQFGNMLDHFENAAARKFIVFNGRHPDGYSPMVLTRWFEFLEFYVARRVPRLHPAVRLLGGQEFSSTFGVEGLEFEPDRFADFADEDYAGALAAYEAEPEVRVLFESGARPDTEPGAPAHRFEASFDTFPRPRRWATATTWVPAAPSSPTSCRPRRASTSTATIPTRGRRPFSVRGVTSFSLRSGTSTGPTSPRVIRWPTPPSPSPRTW